MTARAPQWLDAEAGPVVRPYALVGGRTQVEGGQFELVSMVTAVRGAQPGDPGLALEHSALLRRCRIPVSVADLAADHDLPLGVIRVLLADLRAQGLITVRQPAPRRAGADLLKEVADGLRRL